MIRAARTIAGLELRRRLRDRSMFVQGILAPIGMAAIIGFAFGGGFDFSATIGIADADASAVTAPMVDAMTGGDEDTDSPVRFVSVAPTDADAAIQAGDVDAVIVLPAGLGAAVVSEAVSPGIEVRYDPDRRITADVSVSIARRLTAGLRASQVAVAAALATGPEPVTPERIEQVTTAIAALSQPLLVEHADAGETYSPVAYFAPAMAMIFLFFTIGTGARSLLAERKQGTLARVRAAPVSDVAILVGKTAGVVLLGVVSLAVVWAVTTFAFGADWGSPGAVAALIVGVVFAIAGISVFVTGLARTDAQADGLSAVVAFTLALLGGNFIQPGAMPDALERVAQFTPNGRALAAFTEVGAGDATLAQVWPTVAALVVGGLAIGAFGVVLLGRRVRS